ncbi:MAG: serine/threonine-protein phosphatase [Ruminococcus sp.]|nr:serine/threonine-protein phosphatase [Ruminococcus sp.]
MNYYLFGYTDKGGYRDNNEDAVLIDREVFTEGTYEAAVRAPLVAAICDGVGGENAGELAAKHCLLHLSILDYDSSTDMERVVMNIHGKIKRKSVYEENAANMQTTLCALCIDEEGKGLCVNVGDSRMYRYVNGRIRQISIDQSYGNFLYEHGRVDKISKLSPEHRKAIVSSLGSTQNEPDIAQTPLVSEFGEEPDDMIIIVSDGVSDYVSLNEFEIGLGMDLPISDKLIAIAKLALINGSTDNVSILGVKPYIDDEELRALTDSGKFEETVNINDMLTENDPLSDILSIDLDEIIGKKAPEPEPEHHEIVSPEDIELEAHDLFMQAQASLSRLSQLFNDEEKDKK